MPLEEKRTDVLDLEELNPCTVLCMACRPDEIFCLPVGTKIVEGFCGSAYEEAGIPEGVEILANRAFAGSAQLQWVSLPRTLRVIGEHAFRECTALSEITLPDGITEIRSGTFFGCAALERVSLPCMLRKIGVYAFGCCFSLREVVIPEEVREIGRGAFEGCSALCRIELPAAFRMPMMQKMLYEANIPENIRVYRCE